LSAAKKLWLTAPPIVHALALFILSAQPKLPETPGGDKLAHFAAYALLALLVARAFGGSTSLRGLRLFAIASIVAALYGVSDEIHQSFVPGRDASVEDALADAAGALIGSLGWISLSRVFFDRAPPPRSPLRGGSPREDRAP
jgi:VanZ family protein